MAPIDRTSHAPRFLIYVANGTPNSDRAVHNLTRYLDAHNIDLGALFVIDVLDPDGIQAAARHDVIVTPTLLVETAHTTHRFVGDLSDTRALEQTLGLGTGDAAATMEERQ